MDLKFQLELFPVVKTIPSPFVSALLVPITFPCVSALLAKVELSTTPAWVVWEPNTKSKKQSVGDIMAWQNC
jgi:hypothetical protein